MTAVRREPTWQVLRRSASLIAAMVLLISGGTAVLSKLQPPVYVATAVLSVNLPADVEPDFGAIQASHAHARTLSRLIGSRNIAELASQRLPFTITPDKLLDRMQFQPVNETQLLEVNASDADPARARELANTYAATFVTYVDETIPTAAPSAVVSVVDRAVVPRSPDRPRPTLYTLVALVLSTALALSLVLLRSRLDNRLHDADALANEFGLPVLGVLPRTKGGRHAERLLEESVRLLCTSLVHASAGRLGSVVVTSSRRDEGKSTVAAELATTLAALSPVKHAVLAVDADLRHPTLHLRLRPPLDDDIRGRCGLADYLRGEQAVDEVALPTALPGLRLMPAGGLPSHPSALLGFATSRTALRELGAHAEVVILDTPPLDLGADAALIAQGVDTVLLVVDLGRTRLPELRSAVDTLSNVGVRPLGFVVNRAQLPRGAAASADAVHARPEGGGRPGRRITLRPREDASPASRTPQTEMPAPDLLRPPASSPDPARRVPPPPSQPARTALQEWSERDIGQS